MFFATQIKRRMMYH